MSSITLWLLTEFLVVITVAAKSSPLGWVFTLGGVHLHLSPTLPHNILLQRHSGCRLFHLVLVNDGSQKHTSRLQTCDMLNSKYEGDDVSRNVANAPNLFCEFGGQHVSCTTQDGRMSLVWVRSRISEPEDWPPLFGSVADAYTIRRLLGFDQFFLTNSW